MNATLCKKAVPALTERMDSVKNVKPNTKKPSFFSLIYYNENKTIYRAFKEFIVCLTCEFRV